MMIGVWAQIGKAMPPVFFRERGLQKLLWTRIPTCSKPLLGAIPKRKPFGEGRRKGLKEDTAQTAKATGSTGQFLLWPYKASKIQDDPEEDKICSNNAEGRKTSQCGAACRGNNSDVQHCGWGIAGDNLVDPCENLKLAHFAATIPPSWPAQTSHLDSCIRATEQLLAALSIKH
ncbi:unnamed protein product [Lepeophtheirus salmonis]|uniref:(salmon louse) hypothetical protein n=1 Tax=Lepeophtheirus salmonis TaxID=72036 RepID=A0A7R8H3I3_LEPSM|nr:unnamed protein product [Lepeophtheirus salmonis]CAF2830460.1 unnamed protein product [Lepeophtheirus salmonis]